MSEQPEVEKTTEQNQEIIGKDGKPVKYLRGKKEKKPKVQTEKPPEPDPAVYIDARVGKIIHVEPVEDSEFLYKEDVDVGNGITKHIVTSVRKYYTVEQLQDRRVCVFTNMHPAKMRGETSEAMLFGASTPDPDICELLDPPADSPIGARIFFGHFTEGEVTGQDRRNTHWKKMVEHLGINDQGVACYKGEPLHTAEGNLTVPNLRNCEFH
ncbi:tRNA binding [Trichomonas vaginalis G3]|uniref:tRNA binding n=1 Tax=Trichomonas vaginalis (strain ATCC PRA-98 / G3) TaxID=412133 RepID=UPI0021E5A39C|nr:tRNA binding [Trichomonas vaginalis G3]KAI5499009.1 tRNA binding [Trichomonas vaginalis G3]